ncbi:NUDIX hydrolase [Actinomadura monticuli]|uniref:NUDIX domain-containing protein n=1 Tax=Actinomadura monticuli TaxID=3097367 RepID=A0ABV4Q8K2_9ACTN
MDRPLARDGHGNTLLAFVPAPCTPPTDAPTSVALTVLWHGPRVLLVFDRRRSQWELPGGMIEPGETPLRAAIRELHEESGLHVPALVLAGYAHFHLPAPPRHEYAALYTGHALPGHAFTPSRAELP